jgi:diguanylate cyclase (GGDEF)-like protein/PAS domain S-box-containing protein
MKNWIRRWFAPPIFDDDETHRQAILLTAIMAVFQVFLVIFFAGTLIGTRFRPGTLVLLLAMLADTVLVRFYLRRRRIKLAGIWVLASGLVLLTGLIITLGTVRAPATAAYVLLVIIAGMLFDARGTVIATAAASLAVLGLMLAENAGLLARPDFSIKVTQWITYTALFALTGTLTYYARRLMDQALARAHKEIKERKQAENELQKLILSVEQSPASVVITDLGGRIEYVNPHFSQTTGYSPTEAIGQNPRFLKSNLTPEETYRQLWETLTTGQEWRGEFTNRKKDSSIFYESAIISPVKDTNGTVTHYIGIKEDVTESKRMRQTIVCQRDLAQALASATSIQAALQLCLEHILEVTGLDCGGVYLVIASSKDLQLTTAHGLTNEFLERTSRVPAGSLNWQTVMAGKAIYTTYDQIRSENSPTLINEGLRAFGVIPVLHQGEVIASFNIASHCLNEISPINREFIEEIALQVANALVRIEAQEELQHSHDALQASEARFRSLFDQTHDAVLVIDLEGRYLSANPVALGLLGYSLEEIQCLHVVDLSQEPEKSRGVLADLLAGKEIPLFERSHRKKDGQVFPAEVNVQLIRDLNGTPTHFQSTMRDISERKRVEAVLRESEAKYRIVADNTYDWEFWADPAGNFIYVSPSCRSVSGYEPRELMADPGLSKRIIHPEDREVVDWHDEFFIEAHVKDALDFRILHKDGSIRWISQNRIPIFAENGDYLGVRGSNRDITRRKEIENELQQANEQLSVQLDLVTQLKDQLHEQSLLDPLTGLHNRRYLMEVLPREVIRAERERYSISIIMADIDYFKGVNDQYGHAVGDEILKMVAVLVKRCARGSDVFCRYGGEEFLIVLLGANLDIALKRAEKFRQKCAEATYYHEGNPVNITISLGVASYPQHGREIESVLVKADKAMYLSKSAGRNSVTAWEEETPPAPVQPPDPS